MEIITVKQALHHQYPGQFEPQSVYLEIDPENQTISMDWYREIGNGVPEDVWHRRILWYILSIVPTVDVANQLMDDVLPLAERVVAGHSIEWDGCNHVGRLTEDAQDASDGIRDIVMEIGNDPGNRQIAWDWECCYDGCVHVMRADATEEEIDEAVAEVEALAASEGAILEFDLTAKLREIRDEMQAEEAVANGHYHDQL